MQIRNLSPSKMKPTTTSQCFWLWSLTTLTTKSTLMLLVPNNTYSFIWSCKLHVFHHGRSRRQSYQHVHRLNHSISQCSLYFCLGATKPTSQIRVKCDPIKDFVPCLKWKSGSRLAFPRLRPCIIFLCPLISSSPCTLLLDTLDEPGSCCILCSVGFVSRIHDTKTAFF